MRHNARLWGERNMETCLLFGRWLADSDATAMDHVQKQQAQRGGGAAVAHQPAVEAETAGKFCVELLQLLNADIAPTLCVRGTFTDTQIKNILQFWPVDNTMNLLVASN